MITDFHNHLFPDNMAKVAIKKLHENSVAPYAANPTQENLRSAMKNYRVVEGGTGTLEKLAQEEAR